jgi:hypothetical protein
MELLDAGTISKLPKNWDLLKVYDFGIQFSGRAAAEDPSF